MEARNATEVTATQKISVTRRSFLDKDCFFKGPAEQLQAVKHEELEPVPDIIGNPFAGHKHTHWSLSAGLQLHDVEQLDSKISVLLPEEKHVHVQLLAPP